MSVRMLIVVNGTDIWGSHRMKHIHMVITQIAGQYPNIKSQIYWLDMIHHVISSYKIRHFKNITDPIITYI